MSGDIYIDSKTLLNELAKKDSSFAWGPIFKAATEQTNSKALAASSGPTLREHRIALGTGMLYAGIQLVIVGSTLGLVIALLIMSLFQTDTVFAFSFAFLFGGIAALCLAAGIVELALAHARRKDNKTIVFPSLVDIEPVVPLPISYKLRSDLGPEGELLAYLTRYTSEITPEGDIRERAQKYAPLRLGNDDDANDLSENFETLLADVKELERAAARPYTRILIHNGLTEEQLPDSKCKLQDRIERARDRLQLNSGIVSSFNKRAQDSSEEVLHETPEEPHQQLAFETV